MSWPVQSGQLLPLAASYVPRPETGFGAAGGVLPEQQVPFVRADEAGSYVLTGSGGTGKSQLAAAYAHTLWRSRDIELLVWITASSRAAILTGYARACLLISKAAGGPGTPADGYGSGQDQEAAARRFLSWLAESTRSWLVVLDDLADAADMEDLWPRGAMGRTVLTTRLLPASVSPPSQHAKLVQVGPYSRREALAYLTARLFEDTAQRNAAVDLAETLDCLPIALGHAAALISDCRIDCGQYRTQFLQRRQAMGIRPDAGDPGIVAATWSIALDRTDQLLPSALARPVLAMLAMLDPNGIPASVFASSAAREYVGSYAPERTQATEQQIGSVLSGLAQAGLVTIDPQSVPRTVYIHPLVQECIRSVLPAAVRDQAAAAAASAVLQSWPEQNPDADLDQALRDCAATLREAAGPVMWEPHGHPLLLRAGRSLDAARLSGPAIAYWRELADTSGEQQEPGSAQTLRYLQLLAEAYEAADRADLALDVLTQSLGQLEESLGPGHPDTLTARAHLGRACQTTGRLGEAITHFERTLAGREWVLGPDHPDTLASRSDLASAYRADGRIEDAIGAFRRALTDQELILGEDHPTTAATRTQLAAALQSAGRVKDAVSLYARTLADRERVLGPGHPDTITARGNLAYAYRSAGKLKEAIPIYARTLADRERVLGPDHPDTLVSRGNLAAAYFSARKLKEAIPLYEQTVADRERVLGPDHPDTLIARGNLASAYHAAGRLVVATQLQEQTLADYERVLGPYHENTLTSRANLAMTYCEGHRMPEAIALFQHTLKDCEHALPSGHPLTRSVRESLDAATRA